MALLTTWLDLQPSYLAQICTYTGATHTQEIMQLWKIFLKLLIFWKNHISHLVPLCIMYFEIHITMNYFCVACIYTYFNGDYFIGWFGHLCWWAYAIMNCLSSGILHHHWRHCLYTVFTATGLITETSYLAYIYVHMSLVYAHVLVCKYNPYF